MKSPYFFNTSRHVITNNRNTISNQCSFSFYHRLLVSLLLWVRALRQTCMLVFHCPIKIGTFLAFCMFGSCFRKLAVDIISDFKQFLEKWRLLFLFAKKIYVLTTLKLFSRFLFCFCCCCLFFLLFFLLLCFLLLLVFCFCFFVLWSGSNSRHCINHATVTGESEFDNDHRNTASPNKHGMHHDNKVTSLASHDVIGLCVPGINIDYATSNVDTSLRGYPSS